MYLVSTSHPNTGSSSGICLSLSSRYLKEANSVIRWLQEHVAVEVDAPTSRPCCSLRPLEEGYEGHQVVFRICYGISVH